MNFEQLLRDACNSDDPASAVFGIYTLADNDLAEFNRGVITLLQSPDHINALEPCAVHIIPDVLGRAVLENHPAVELLELIGRHALPKEIIIAANESLERFGQSGDLEDASAIELEYLVQLYSAAFPRLVLRKLTAEATLRPILTDLDKAWQRIVPIITHDEGRQLFSSVMRLLSVCYEWAKGTIAQNPESHNIVQTTLLAQLNSAILISLPHLQSALALEAFQSSNPNAMAPWRRLRASDAVESSRNLMQQALGMSLHLGATFESHLQLTRSTTTSDALASLVLLAHDFKHSIPAGALEPSVPMLVSSFMTGNGADEALAWLVRCLDNQSGNLPEEVILPLFSALVQFSSLHPDPPTRQVAFDTLSYLISYAPSRLKLPLFSELLVECPFPQMRAGAITIIKTAVLSALDSDEPSPLASSNLLPLLTTVFRPDPPDLFESYNLALASFIESGEAFRVISALGLYFVVISRDTENKIGLRDQSCLRRVQETFFDPLRALSTRWEAEARENSDSLAMSLFSLVGGLDRVEKALGQI